ncbi:hypothetical protein VMCG_09295 [Cytospora schulzeri]|uniref:3'-5' exonuclease domain-containing protein n=1 Tax=Cytospora schulzeri TaxID=448051 RepID=A0A423VMF8_9PEZI|nr:hypothetical protein VMCG_09295 [Valsa malicola]
MTACSNCVVSSVTELTAFLSSIPRGSTLYLDLEGENLSRHGTITLVTILVHPQNITAIIDVLTLGTSSFNTSSANGRSLKSILEDPSIPKCIWDLRNDTDALWAHYRVGLTGVTDIQLLENASRLAHRDKNYLSGLDNAIRYDLKLGYMDQQRWSQTKQDIRRLMPTGIFSKRPLDAKVIEYCVNDVKKLPDLQAVYMKRITPDWLRKAQRAMDQRLTEARSPGYQPQSREKAFGPWRSESVSYRSLEDALDDWRVAEMDDAQEMEDALEEWRWAEM